MAERSAFEKIHVDERDKADLGGVLEQLNLPPTVVEFVRRNQRTIYIVLAVITAVVVFWALYDSHAQKKVADSASALTLAKQLEGDEQISALESVISDYSGTQAALWAKIELARHFSEQDEFNKALKLYQQAGISLSESNPLFPLVTFAIAQTEESLSNYEAALSHYNSLKEITGYANLGYTGAARIHEEKGEVELAIQEYEEYLGTMIGDSVESGERLYISEKISGLKASQ